MHLFSLQFIGAPIVWLENEKRALGGLLVRAIDKKVGDIVVR